MSRRPRRNHSPKFKAKVVLAAVRGEKRLAELTEQFDAHPNKFTQWKGQLLERAAKVFGSGKTHLATAIGVQAVTHSQRRTGFFSTVELINALEQEKAAGKQGQLAARLATLYLVILGELGYLPLWQRVAPYCST